MLVYKCDGESYSTGKKCASEAKNELPERWLVITGRIKNGLYDAHYIEANGTRHFCSRRCLMNFLFKDVNLASGQSGVNYMQQDPNLQAASQQEQANEATEQATTEQANAQESAAQDAAVGATEE